MRHTRLLLRRGQNNNHKMERNLFRFINAFHGSEWLKEQAIASIDHNDQIVFYIQGFRKLQFVLS